MGVCVSENSELEIVLDLGSGAAPWSQSNVLVDRFYVDPTGERSGAPIYKDSRPLIIADGERLPFKDGSVQYIFCRHVVEHATDAAKFLEEISRVGQAGYLECPNPLLERVLNQLQHRWYLVLRDERLLVCEKNEENNLTTELDKVFFELLNEHYLIRNYWDLFTVQLHWKDHFAVELQDSMTEILGCSVTVEEIRKRIRAQRLSILLKGIQDVIANTVVNRLRRTFKWPVVSTLHRTYKWVKLGRKPSLAKRSISVKDLYPVFCCPHDHSDLSVTDEYLVCDACNRQYPLFDGGVNFCPEDNIV